MTEPTETTGENGPIEIDVDADPVADEPGTDGSELKDSEVDEGPRAVEFETATEKLDAVFDVDGRRGETITDLETTETEAGRQVVATVEKSRSTMLRHRFEGAKRTGRRVGGGLTALAALAGMVYVALARRGGDEPDEATDEAEPRD